MKYVLPLTLIFFSASAFSQVTLKWLGITGLVLSDQTTTLIFDPAMTRVHWYELLPFTTVKSNEEEVDYWMKKCDVKAIQGTFVNHAHTDHVIDAPYVVKKYGGDLYGSSSVVNVGLGQGLTPAQVHLIKPGEDWKIGDFTIRPFNTPHAPHILDIMFMSGHIVKPLPSPTSAWNYLVGDTYSFLITHPKGTILYQSMGVIEDQDPLKDVKADVLLLTIANRTSSEDLIQKRVLPSKARMVIPLHYDNLLFDMRRDNEIDVLWGLKIDEFKETLKAQAKDVKANWPHYCEEVTLL